MIDLIIPIYNAKSTLDLTLMSIKMQTIIDKITVYLIDDCSKDNYEEILENHKDMNIIYKRLDKNSGPAVARQVGIDISSNKYIMFIDADDLFYDTDSVKKLLNTIEDDYDYAVGITIEEKRQIEIMNESDLHGKIYRRKFIEEKNIRFNNTRFHEDNYFNNLVLLSEPRMKELLEDVYIYVNNNESITNVQQEKEFERLEIYISNLKELIEEAKKRNCKRERIINMLFYKVKYFNRIWENFTEEQKNTFKLWLKKYNLKIEKYLNNTSYETLYEEMLNEYSY
jgi:glycosyltransferase involved in cell wall biosynthesis